MSLDSVITQVKKGEAIPLAPMGNSATQSDSHDTHYAPQPSSSSDIAASGHDNGSASQNRTPPPKKKGFFSSLFCWCKGKDSKTQKREQIYSQPPQQEFLLGPQAPEDVGKKCLVLDLDETLVHSSFTPVPNADFVIPVEIEGQTLQVYVLKRPGVDQFMAKVGEHFEVVVFTASLAKYANPVLDLLDKKKVVKARLFREACTKHKGNFVKDMGRMGRDLKSIIIIDNSPISYMFNPSNAIPIDSWFEDMNDRELLELIPFLEGIAKVDDVCSVLDNR